MKSRRFFCYFFAIAMLYISMFSVQVYAENNLVPYDPGGQQATSQQSPSGGENTSNYTDGLFQDITISRTDQVDGAINSVGSIISVVITFIIGVSALFFALQFVLDIACILIRPVAVLVAGLPIELNSAEAIAATGVPYSGAGAKSGAAPAAPAHDDAKGHPLLFFLRKRLYVFFIAMLMFTLIGSGVMFKVLSFAINHIVSWISSMV